MHTVCLFHLAFISSDVKGEPLPVSSLSHYEQSEAITSVAHSADPPSPPSPTFLSYPSAGHRVHNPGSGSGEATDLSQGGVRHHAGLLAEGAAAAAEH